MLCVTTPRRTTSAQIVEPVQPDLVSIVEIHQLRRPVPSSLLVVMKIEGMKIVIYFQMLRVTSLFSSITRYFGHEPIEMIASKTD